MKKHVCGIMLLAIAALTAPTMAHATFILDPNPGSSTGNDTFLYLNTAKDATALTGNVGSHDGALINIAANTAVDVTAGGFGTIQDVHGALSSLIFTPGDSTKYGDFSFRGQLSSEGSIFLTIVNQIGAIFTFDITDIAAHRDFTRIGVISNDGDWLTSATVSTDQFFNEMKQIEFSLQDSPAAVPEPGTVMLLGVGFIGLAIYGKRRRSAV